MTTPPKPSAADLAKTSKLFDLLDEQGCARLLEGASCRAMKAGEVICREGEKGEEFFSVQEGSVKVVADSFGTEKQIARLGVNAFFGEMAVVANQPRSATVVAETAGMLLVFKKPSVDAVLKDYPKVREALNSVGVARTEELLGKLSES